jgi:putative membrane protein
MEGMTVFTALESVGILAHWGPGGGFGWLFLLVPLFWILVFGLIFGIVGRRWRREGWAGHGYAAQPSRSAEASLAERFAQGDIDEQEYRARLEVLRVNAYPGQTPKP